MSQEKPRRIVRIDKVTTRGGDKGYASLVGGHRLPKSHALFDLIGQADSVNSQLGLASALLEESTVTVTIRTIITEVQQHLFDMGADLATPWSEDYCGTPPPEKAFLRLDDPYLTRLEHHLEELNANLPPLTSFVLPAGAPAVTQLHVVRCAARQFERALVAAAEGVNPQLVPYVNRLSDLCFVMARSVDHAQAGREVLWNPHSKEQPKENDA